MQLPEKFSDDYSIDYNRENVSVGDILYCPNDGVIHRITDSSSLSFELYDTWQEEHWKTSKDGVNDNLYVDYFPLQLVGHYPQ